jgi:hypothetical protein
MIDAEGYSNRNKVLAEGYECADYKNDYGWHRESINAIDVYGQSSRDAEILRERRGLRAMPTCQRPHQDRGKGYQAKRARNKRLK